MVCWWRDTFLVSIWAMQLQYKALWFFFSFYMLKQVGSNSSWGSNGRKTYLALYSILFFLLNVTTVIPHSWSTTLWQEERKKSYFHLPLVSFFLALCMLHVMWLKLQATWLENLYFSTLRYYQKCNSPFSPNHDHIFLVWRPAKV